MSSAGPSTAAPTAAHSFKPLIAYFFEPEPDDRIMSISFGHKATFASAVHTSRSNAQGAGLRVDFDADKTTYSVPFQTIERADSRAWQDTLEQARSSTTILSGSFLSRYYNNDFHLTRRRQREEIQRICKEKCYDVVEVTDKSQWEIIKSAPHSVGIFPYGTELPSLPPAKMKTFICWSHRREGDASSSRYILEAGLGAVLPAWDTTEADGQIFTLNGEEDVRIIAPSSLRAFQRKSEFDSVTNPDLPEVEGFVETMSGIGSPVLLYAAGSINETVAAQLGQEKGDLLRKEMKSCLVVRTPSKDFSSFLARGLLTRINLGDQWGTQ
ncbi:hypothetical protein JCM24511_00639 [Saitozyma sp. JCM 24511]|nr:hypothetical protein JCM24511_00639 [Saitozyma sp. JCM 24511]